MSSDPIRTSRIEARIAPEARRGQTRRRASTAILS
jgi:hypothetical protein